MQPDSEFSRDIEYVADGPALKEVRIFLHEFHRLSRETQPITQILPREVKFLSSSLNEGVPAALVKADARFRWLAAEHPLWKKVGKAQAQYVTDCSQASKLNDLERLLGVLFQITVFVN